MSMDAQKRNYEFFEKQLSNLLADPLKIGKFAVIYDETVEGIYDTFEIAYKNACTRYIDGFIVQQIIDERKIVSFLSPAIGTVTA